MILTNSLSMDDIYPRKESKKRKPTQASICFFIISLRRIDKKIFLLLLAQFIFNFLEYIIAINLL